MALTPQWLDELRARVTLSSVVMRTTKLQKAGREWKACCPFHNEKTPSFTVNDDKGFYHCFGCGAHGDVIRWMTDQRGLAFMDAVKELASEAGMEVPRADPREAERAEQRAGLHDVMASAQEWFKNNFLGDEGRKARDYLASRGLDGHTIERFGFGYALNGRNALKAALAQYPEAMLIEAGLLIAVDDKEPYDRFRGRLMLPIQDARGRVIAFGGRIFDKSKIDAPKYLNSPDTSLFDKGRTLYNLHRAAPASRKTGRVVVVEGYLDVIALAAAGIDESVAPMGTALTERQIELLWRLVPVPILCFDGDQAGQNAMMRAAQRVLPILRAGHSFSIVHMPPGVDPDDFLRSRGAEAFEAYLSSSNTLLDSLWDFEKSSEPLRTPEDKAGLRKRLLEHVERIQDRDIRGLYRRDLLDMFYAFAFPRPKEGKWGSSVFDTKISPQVAEHLKDFVNGGARIKLSRAVLAGLALRPNLIGFYIEKMYQFKPQDMGHAVALDILMDACDEIEAGKPPSEAALRAIVAPQEMRYLPFLQPGCDEEKAKAFLGQAVELLVDRPEIESAVDAATFLYEQTLSDEMRVRQEEARQRKAKFDAKLKALWREYA